MSFEQKIQTSVSELLELARASPSVGTPICQEVLKLIEAGVAEIRRANNQGLSSPYEKEKNIESQDLDSPILWLSSTGHDTNQMGSGLSIEDPTPYYAFDQHLTAGPSHLESRAKSTLPFVQSQNQGLASDIVTAEEGGATSRHELHQYQQIASKNVETTTLAAVPGPADQSIRKPETNVSVKRGRQVGLRPADLEAVLWLESQPCNSAAFAAMQELLNNWEQIAEAIFHPVKEPERSSKSLLDTRPNDDLSLFIYLGGRLSTGGAEAWATAILRRIHAALFHQLYAAAIEDARLGPVSSFFHLSDERIRASGQVPIRKSYKGYTSSAAVRDRLVDLIYLDATQSPQISKDRCRERIHVAHQDGKRWWRIIQTFGYQILLCLPPELTDNRMKLTDAQMDVLLPAWSAKMATFGKNYAVEAREAMEKTFMPYIRTLLEVIKKQGGFFYLPGHIIMGTDRSWERAGTRTTTAREAPSSSGAQTQSTAVASNEQLGKQSAEELGEDEVDDLNAAVDSPSLTIDEVGDLIDILMRGDHDL